MSPFSRVYKVVRANEQLPPGFVRYLSEMESSCFARCVFVDPIVWIYFCFMMDSFCSVSKWFFVNFSIYDLCPEKDVVEDLKWWLRRSIWLIKLCCFYCPKVKPITCCKKNPGKRWFSNMFVLEAYLFILQDLFGEDGKPPNFEGQCGWLATLPYQWKIPPLKQKRCRVSY